jgi:hypothetical protein
MIGKSDKRREQLILFKFSAASSIINSPVTYCKHCKTTKFYPEWLIIADTGRGGVAIGPVLSLFPTGWKLFLVVFFIFTQPMKISREMSRNEVNKTPLFFEHFPNVSTAV